MARNNARELAILFADISGSTRLHAEIGDLKAHQYISTTLDRMSCRILHHRGRVIETIGDEIMCAFENADDALDAACSIQKNSLANTDARPDIRIGFHFGMTREDDGHPYGDTVNVAARIAAIAGAGQIMLTDDAWRRLGRRNKSRTHVFGSWHLKGKKTACKIWQASWEQGSETKLVDCRSQAPVERRGRKDSLQLRCSQGELTLEGGTEMLLGRGNQCDLQVDTESVSRIHATLKFEQGTLKLVDRSTNGTFVKTREGKRSTDNRILFLHHEEWISTCGGIVSLGKPVSGGDRHLIYIHCH